MKLALVVGSYPPRVGGLEQHLSSLAQSLTGLGVEVTVFTIGDDPGVRNDGRVRVLTGKRHFPIADIVSFPRLGATRQLAKTLKDEGFDAVSTHTRFFPMSFVGTRAAKRAGIPVVHTEHGSGFVASGSPLIFTASRIVDHTMGRYVLGSANQVLGVSDEAVEFASKLGARKTMTFLNAIPAVDPPLEGTRRPQHLVFVGRMVPGKGWDTFLQAIARLRSEGWEVDGEMLGDGESLPHARLKARELGLDDVVSIRGQVDAPRVREALRGATLVNPTVLSEGFQTTLLEAIAEKGQVVTFPVPGAELLRSQGGPVLVTRESTVNALVDSIRECLFSPPEAAPSGLIDQWTWPRRAREYLEVLESTVSS